jgi:hypothetical protein
MMEWLARHNIVDDGLTLEMGFPSYSDFPLFHHFWPSIFPTDKQQTDNRRLPTFPPGRKKP